MRQMLALLLLITVTLMTGCSKTMATSGTECAVWIPITWSSRDTPETIKQIKASNARRKAWCEGVDTPPPQTDLP
jgi:hypothetical protein